MRKSVSKQAFGRLEVLRHENKVITIPFLCGDEVKEVLLTKYTERLCDFDGNGYIWYDDDMNKRFVFNADSWVMEDWYTGSTYRVGKMFYRSLKEGELIGYHYYGEE